MENNQFRVLYPDFLRVFKENTRFKTAIMLYFDDTLDDDVLMIFDELKVQNFPV